MSKRNRTGSVKVSKGEMMPQAELDRSPMNKKIEILAKNERPLPVFNIKSLEENVANCLQIIDDEVMRGYVTKLSDLPVIEPYFDELKMKNDPYQWLHITKLVYEQDEFSVSKLAAVFQTVSGKNSTLVLMVQNRSHVASFYLGVRNHDEKDFTGTLRQMLETSLKGQFPGSDFDDTFSIESMEKITKNLKNNTNAISSVTCVPDFKQDKEFYENKDFLQGLEKFVISMQGKDYTAVFVADAVPYGDLAAYRTQLESVYTQLSPFANMQYQIGTSSSQSTANTQQEGRTKTTTKGESDLIGTNESVAKADAAGVVDTTGKSRAHGTNSSEADGKSKGGTVTDGTNESTSDGITKTNTVTVGSSQTVGTYAGGSASVAPFGIGGGINAGVNTSLSLNESYGHSVSKSHTKTKGTSHSVGISNTISKTISRGISDTDIMSKSRALSTTHTDTMTQGTSKQHGTNSSYSEAFNFGHAETLTDTFGTSQGIMMQSQNLMIENMLERIKRQIQRISECESIGMWNCAAYFMCKNRAISEAAASIYRSLISGENSGVERSAINTWTTNDKLPQITKYLTHFCHPKFVYSLPGDSSAYFVSPAALVSTKELAIQMSLPRRSVCGLPVTEHAAFGQEIILNRKDCRTENNRKSIDLGRIYHLNTTTDTHVSLDLKSLTMHTFVTGSTGSGKSNTIYHILDELRSKKIPYLVIEPAKGEYKTKFKHANVYGTNPNLGNLLKLNPFSFPEEIHVQEHIDRLAELFNVCWPMYAAMPAVLKDSIIRAYEAAGWDLMHSVNTVSNKLFPTFEDVLRELDVVVKEADYSKDTSSDYKGALKTRLKSLTNGINGMIFSNQEISYANLFDSETIVDLSRVGSIETKSLIMGILVLKLQEYRMSNHYETDSDLRHVTVLEEAHNLLKKTSNEQSQETANLQGKSVEMLTNAIAEMRTYGEGFIIADQAPDLLDTAVIRNTNTKIVLRLPEGTDREITGMAMALNEKQVQELSKLPTGIAAVYQNDWQEALLCDLPEYKQIDLPHKKAEDELTVQEIDVLRMLLSNNDMTDLLRENVLKSDASAKVRRQLLQGYQTKSIMFEWAMADYITNRFNWKVMFDGTNRTCSTIDELGAVMLANITSIFDDFTLEERGRICYYICRKAFEEFPKNSMIEKVRVHYFKERWMK